MNITYRKARREDAFELARLSSQLGYPVDRGELEKRLKAVLEAHQHVVFIAEQSDQLVGWIHAHERLLIESASFIEIGGLIVDAECRGNGVGRNLVRLCEEWAVGEGYTKIRVRTNASRMDARAFYSRIGYHEVKSQQVFDKQIG
ncbi:hypothetical protein AN963_07325 [Brevibacillus choshinensis]|uniref:N-acetyltransferase domain-containing protein n=1 Tax=Brevibacillus choshinensis TaxID=54911 RepID=A0ABR5NDD1_BRECH|nr:GNAT family N-acetyltransferase [Brevibacillus choshinensis]KQL49543.1 hypothetical protein AN963_07325 [Brevibacillus choshinensis]